MLRIFSALGSVIRLGLMLAAGIEGAVLGLRLLLPLLVEGDFMAGIAHDGLLFMTATIAVMPCEHITSGNVRNLIRGNESDTVQTLLAGCVIVNHHRTARGPHR